MLKNYLTIALRSLRRQLLYSFINILGLAVGMACSLVIFLYVYSEWTHDAHFKNAERIHRISVSFYNMGVFANGPELLADYLPNEFAGIETYTRFQKYNSERFVIGENKFNERTFYIDSAFFQVFSYEFIEGDPKTAMENPKSIVLTESTAEKFFKGRTAMGSIIEVGKEREPFVVMGIVRDDDRPSHLKTSVWIPLDEKQLQHVWPSASVYTYVLLKKGVTSHALNRALDNVIANHVYPASSAKKSGKTLAQYIQDENSVKFFTHPLKDIYLKSKLNLELSPGGNEANLYIFAVIGACILVLAAVNFINLSTARATRRAKEVGIRKSLGSSRRRLISQFLLESVLISLFSMTVALCLAELFTFVFYWIAGQQLMMKPWTNIMSLAGIVGFSIVVGLLAGLYPAFYLTGFQPVNVLKGNLQLSGSKGFRNGLVVFQFTVSIALIICTSIIVRQLAFMSNKDLGFNQENVVTFDELHWLKGSAVTFRDEVLRQPGVLNASLHAGEPGSKAIIAFYTYQTPRMQDALTINTYFGDHNFLDVMGFRLVAGRDFNADMVSDTASVILNEAAVRALDIGENPIGAQVNTGLKVIGVVSDFHWESLRSTIAPVAIMVQNEAKASFSTSQLAVKVNSGNIQALLTAAEKLWKQRVTDEPFEYHFLDDNFGALLEKEEVLGKAIGFFTVLAIAISCLGLFGLAAYTTDQRTREIGIRKVLGASVVNILIMLNKQFTRLVVISMAIAVPLSYYAMGQWLSGFAYRTTLSAWIFVGSGLLGLFISFATVAFHSLKASKTNPAETLKCE